METITETRTWAMHCSFISDKNGPLFANFGPSVQWVAFNAVERGARTISVKMIESRDGEYLGMIKDGVLDPRSIRRFSITDPLAGTHSEQLAAFDFDGIPVRLCATQR